MRTDPDARIDRPNGSAANSAERLVGALWLGITLAAASCGESPDKAAEESVALAPVTGAPSPTVPSAGESPAATAGKAVKVGETVVGRVGPEMLAILRRPQAEIVREFSRLQQEGRIDAALRRELGAAVADGSDPTLRRGAIDAVSVFEPQTADDLEILAFETFERDGISSISKTYDALAVGLVQGAISPELVVPAVFAAFYRSTPAALANSIGVVDFQKMQSGNDAAGQFGRIGEKAIGLIGVHSDDPRIAKALLSFNDVQFRVESMEVASAVPRMHMASVAIARRLRAAEPGEGGERLDREIADRLCELLGDRYTSAYQTASLITAIGFLGVDNERIRLLLAKNRERSNEIRIAAESALAALDGRRDAASKTVRMASPDAIDDVLSGLAAGFGSFGREASVQALTGRAPSLRGYFESMFAPEDALGLEEADRRGGGKVRAQASLLPSGGISVLGMTGTDIMRPAVEFTTLLIAVPAIDDRSLTYAVYGLPVAFEDPARRDRQDRSMTPSEAAAIAKIKDWIVAGRMRDLLRVRELALHPAFREAEKIKLVKAQLAHLRTIETGELGTAAIERHAALLAELEGGPPQAVAPAPDPGATRVGLSLLDDPSEWTAVHWNEISKAVDEARAAGSLDPAMVQRLEERLAKAASTRAADSPELLGARRFAWGAGLQAGVRMPKAWISELPGALLAATDLRSLPAPRTTRSNDEVLAVAIRADRLEDPAWWGALRDAHGRWRTEGHGTDFSGGLVEAVARSRNLHGDSVTKLWKLAGIAGGTSLNGGLKQALLARVRSARWPIATEEVLPPAKGWPFKEGTPRGQGLDCSPMASWIQAAIGVPAEDPTGLESELAAPGEAFEAALAGAEPGSRRIGSLLGAGKPQIAAEFLGSMLARGTSPDIKAGPDTAPLERGIDEFIAGLDDVDSAGLVIEMLNTFPSQGKIPDWLKSSVEAALRTRLERSDGAAAIVTAVMVRSFRAAPMYFGRPGPKTYLPIPLEELLGSTLVRAARSASKRGEFETLIAIAKEFQLPGNVETEIAKSEIGASSRSLGGASIPTTPANPPQAAGESRTPRVPDADGGAINVGNRERLRGVEIEADPRVALEMAVDAVKDADWPDARRWVGLAGSMTDDPRLAQTIETLDAVAKVERSLDAIAAASRQPDGPSRAVMVCSRWEASDGPSPEFVRRYVTFDGSMGNDGRVPGSVFQPGGEPGTDSWAVSPSGVAIKAPDVGELRIDLPVDLASPALLARGAALGLPTGSRVIDMKVFREHGKHDEAWLLLLPEGATPLGVGGGTKLQRLLAERRLPLLHAAEGEHPIPPGKPGRSRTLHVIFTVSEDFATTQLNAKKQAGSSALRCWYRVEAETNGSWREIGDGVLTGGDVAATLSLPLPAGASKVRLSSGVRTAKGGKAMTQLLSSWICPVVLSEPAKGR